MRITKLIAVPLIVALLGCSPAPTVVPVPASAPVPVPKPAAFTTSNLTIRPWTVETAYETEIGATVTNTGGEEGTHTVVLKIDGAITKTQNVTLAGGKSEHVVFTVPLTGWSGTQVVMIDQLTGELPAPDPDAH